jgi:hypothetical protein
MEVIDGVAMELKEKLVPPPPPPREAESWFSYESVGLDRWWRGNVVRMLSLLLGGEFCVCVCSIGGFWVCWDGDG